MDLKDLVPDAENRRTHDARNIGMVVDALKHVGAARSIVIDEDNVILAGNGVSAAAAQAGITTVRVPHKRGHSPRWCGPTNEPSVWDEKQPHRNDLHPTMKPVALYQRSLTNHTSARDVVLECFGGSGTTLIAAEQLGRRARVIEIMPGFCQVIVNRWEQFTGHRAVKVGDA